MAFYDEMAVMALEMITEFGQPVTISKTEPGEYDPETGGEAPGATVEQIAQAFCSTSPAKNSKTTVSSNRATRSSRSPRRGWPGCRGCSTKWSLRGVPGQSFLR